jgi:hypothetical protein
VQYPGLGSTHLQGAGHNFHVNACVPATYPPRRQAVIWDFEWQGADTTNMAYFAVEFNIAFSRG